MAFPILFTSVAYFLVLLAIGLYFYRRSVNIEDFLLGGRAMGSWVMALAGIVIRVVVLVLWKQVGLSEYMYEIVPGFISNCITIFLINSNLSQKNKRVLKQFDEVVSVITRGEQT